MEQGDSKCVSGFDHIDKSILNFQCQPNSLQLIFGQAFLIPGSSGSDFDPQRGSFWQIYLHPGYNGHTFLEMGGQCKTCWEQNCDFQLVAQENRAGRWDCLGDQPKFWNINIFHNREPCLYWMPVAFYFTQLFDLTEPCGPHQNPGKKVLFPGLSNKRWEFRGLA